MFEAITLLIGTLTTSLIALLVYLKNRSSVTHKLFIALAFCMIGWSATTYLSLHASSDAQTLFWIRWIMFFVVAQNTFFFLLVHIFPDSHTDIFKQKRYIAAIIYSCITAIVAVSPFLFARFQNGAPQPGPGMALFMPHALIFALGGIVTLVIRHHREQGLKKAHLLYFLLGTFLMVTIEPLGNFVLPLAFHTNMLVRYSSLYAIVFSGLIAYGIVTKKLFDIHAFVVRATAYISSVILLSLVYIVPAILLVAYTMGIRFTWTRFGIGTVVAVFFALFYGSVRDGFNRLTNRIFYRGYYEPQDVLNQLSDLLVRTIDVDYLKRQSNKILRSAIRTKDFDYWLAADPGAQEYTQLLAHLYKKGNADNILVVNEYDVGSPALERLIQNNIAIVVRLRTTKEDLGFITLGFKESGEQYTEKDKRLLSIAADEIAISLQNALHFEEIQDFNRTLQAKVAEATKELRRNNDKLKELDETKDDFISMASHQLRTPLTSVKGYLSMVLEGDAGKISPMQRKMLGQAYISSQRMVYMIADLLNVSRLKTGKFVIETSPVNLSTMIEEEIAQLKETAESRDLMLAYDKPAGFPQLMLDETKTRQVVMNFIDNAIYYTPPGGHITVELRDKLHAVELRVVDDGIGVPKSEQPHLFTKFYRAGNARKARPDGTGLGLFMAKKVVVAQGGAIIFDSSEGKGSTFGFTFPKDKAHIAPRTEVAPEKPVALAK
ncbi:MAG TPA: ATP-binding protein [Candidatus Saccharimonadales bacterium]|nr:ATP-binding protein [Candidatus Saccharimonadales bacterium]